MSDKLVSLDRLKDYKTIENGMVAYIEDSSTATRAHPVGDKFYYLGILRIATADIALGGTITPDTNCEDWIITEGIDKKADADGASDNLVAGTSKGMLADTGSTNQVPYLFRKAPDKASRLTDKIVGGTIAWNQFAQNGNFASDSNWSTQSNATKSISNNIATITITTATGAGQLFQMVNVVANHKYLACGYIKPSANKNIYMRFGTITGGGPYSCIADTWNFIWTIKTSSSIDSYGRSEFNFYIPEGHINVGETYQVKNATCFDLTQMFGSTVADQIYTMEQATAGAGVAYFKSLFPKPYYAYNAGELMSVNTSAHVTRGFNAWNEEWEVGTINSSGQPSQSDNNNQIRSKSFSEIKPNTKYYATCGRTDGGGNNVYYLRVNFYDSNQNYISFVYTNNAEFTTPSNAAYFKINTNGSTVVYGNTYTNDICVNLSDPALNGKYKPYEAPHTYPLDSSLTLRGIPKKDASNKLYYDGDTYESNGTVTRRYASIDLGSLTWTYMSENTYMRSSVVSDAKKPPNTSGWINAICGNLELHTAVNFATDSSIYGFGMDDAGQLRVRYANMPTEANAFKTAVTGIYVIYELATPTTETADPFTNPQICSPYGTEEYLDTRDVAVPVGHDTFYHEDLKGKIEGLPWNFASLIAPTEVEFKATRAYTANDFLIVNNVLYKATTSIASGATITVGTNVTATTIAEVLKALLS